MIKTPRKMSLVQALGLTHTHTHMQVEDLYRQALGKDSKAVKKDAIGAGVGHGVSLFTTFFLYFTGFAGGALLMRTNGYTFMVSSRT